MESIYTLNCDFTQIDHFLVSRTKKISKKFLIWENSKNIFLTKEIQEKYFLNMKIIFLF